MVQPGKAAPLPGGKARKSAKAPQATFAK